MKPIYLDYAATSPVAQCAKEEVIKYMDLFYNPSAAYAGAQTVRQAIEEARASIASCVGADPEEIFFTSGATEGNNTIVNALLHNISRNFITTDIEHHSVLNLANPESYTLHVDYAGLINPTDIVGAIDNNDLVSVIMVNNETGMIQPIKDIARVVLKGHGYMHTDMTQAVGHIHIDCHDLNVDFATASGHKFGAPKGVGFMYIRKEVQCLISPFMIGGGQEFGMRSGTENVAGIMAMAAALKQSTDSLDANLKHIKSISAYLKDELTESGINFSYNHPDENHYNGINNICLIGNRSEEVVEFLSSNNIYVSSGSACNTHDDQPSHVLLAMGLTPEQADASIRVSVSAETTKEEIDALVKALKFYNSLRSDEE